MIYLDNGATTPMDPRVLEAMLPYLKEQFGNPSSLHRLGSTAAAALQSSRETVAEALGVDPGEIVFTGGGTEADNIGVRGAALSASPRRRHALIFCLEHPAVRGQREFLERLGFEVEEIPCNREGLCDLHALEALVRPKETALVCVMHANNEIGSIQPIAEIGELLEDLCPQASFHVDAVQSFTKLPVRPRSFRGSTVALAGHKFHGPKGVGVLYVAKGARLRPLVTGGGQERAVRPGTENVASIVGFAAATRIALETMKEDSMRMKVLRDQMIDEVLGRVPRVTLNGGRTHRLCNNVNLNFSGARAEVLLHALEEHGIFASSGSACHAGQTGPSAVLRAIGLTEKDTGSLRLTLSRMTSPEEVAICIEVLPKVVPVARS